MRRKLGRIDADLFGFRVSALKNTDLGDLGGFSGFRGLGGFFCFLLSKDEPAWRGTFGTVADA